MREQAAAVTDFSKVISPLNVLCKKATEPTFENFQQKRALECRQWLLADFSKVISPLNVLCAMTIEMTFENDQRLH